MIENDYDDNDVDSKGLRLVVKVFSFLTVENQVDSK